jgi:hypothetical protein
MAIPLTERFREISEDSWSLNKGCAQGPGPKRFLKE